MGLIWFLGTREDALSAHALWQEEKINNLKSVIDEYSKSEFFDSRVSDALKKRVDRMTKDLQNGEETTCL